MDIQIRLAQSDDLSDIMDLQARSLRELSKGIYSAAQIESLVKTQSAARAQSFKSGDETIYVACLGPEENAPNQHKDRIIAIASLISYCTQIGGLYVDPDYARRGVASQLLTEVETIATAQKMRVLRVMSSLVAIPFYEAMGYSRLFSKVVRFNGEKVGCMEMAKALNSSGLHSNVSSDVSSDMSSDLNSDLPGYLHRNVRKELRKALTQQVAWAVAPLVIVVAVVWVASS